MDKFITPATPTAQLAYDTIIGKPTKGIPSWMLHIMEQRYIERVAGVAPGDYAKNPEQTYIAMQRALGTCLLDQFLWDNPLTMGVRGFEGRRPGATTGAREIIVDGISIDSPEAVVEHMERFAFPRLKAEADAFDEDARFLQILAHERQVQDKLGPTILKSGHGFVRIPALAYGTYGYVAYFSAYALYPEVIEEHFRLQADIALLNNRAAARAYTEGGLPPLHRIDHDIADSRGTLVRVETLEKLWFPHLARCLEPLLKANVRLIWHCDGNLMEIIPRLLDVGIKGFQGFQYEDGMDYEKICRMKACDGDGLTIIAGVSVTHTLATGTPGDVKRELEWLVEKGPRIGLFLGASSSIVPGTPWENIETLIEGLKHYQGCGKQ